MDGFQTHCPSTPEEAVALYHSLEKPMYIAGGTDLLPNLKHRIVEPKNLVAIGRAVPKGWTREGDRWAIGAGTRLSQLARMTEIPPLAQAAGLVAGPQIRSSKLTMLLEKASSGCSVRSGRSREAVGGLHCRHTGIRRQPAGAWTGPARCFLL